MFGEKGFILGEMKCFLKNIFLILDILILIFFIGLFKIILINGYKF